MVEQGDPGGIVFPMKVVRGPEAELLADAAGTLSDLMFSQSAVAELLRIWPVGDEQGPDGTIPRSLWTAAATSYARAFSGGIRARVADNVLERVDSNARATHEYVMTLRDKHLAHSVNALEQTQVAVALGDEPGLEAVGVASFSLIRILEDRPTTVTFHQLATGLIRELSIEIETLRQPVLDAANRLTPAARAALPEAILAAPDPRLFGQRRRHS